MNLETLNLQFNTTVVNPSTLVTIELDENQFPFLGDACHPPNIHEKFIFPALMQQYATFTEYNKIQMDKYHEEQQLLQNQAQKMSRLREVQSNNGAIIPFSIINIPPGWEILTENADCVKDLQQIFSKLQELYYLGYTIYPREQNIFKAFELCPFNKIRVVILGQDPYETVDKITGTEKAVGMSYSGIRNGEIPYPLARIFTELKRTWPDIRLEHSDLSYWAQQGVFLLNTALTVNRGDAGSHTKNGMYKHFMEYIIAQISEKVDNVAFLLWGRPTEKFEPIISKRAFVLKSGHPSGRTSSEYTFNENGHFASLYNYFASKNLPQIDWSLTSN